MYNTKVRGILIHGNKSYSDVSRDVIKPMDDKTPMWWWVTAFLATGLLFWGVWGFYNTISNGIGEWGLNNNVAWGWAIINFVWWIGIGHAGTAFSIFLLILRQKWRTSINRAAEAMTIFAVLSAGLFPLIHMGRIWDGFFIFPYWNTRGPLWDNFNSPLFWDVVAISTYLMASFVFWYMGMIPDFATIRERTTSKMKAKVYGILSFGWIGNARGWLRFETAALLLGGMAAPLVVSVHSIVSMDFAVSVVPGWHTTIFPPYFVVGAIFSGFGMVLTLMIVLRKLYKFKDYVTDGHLDAIARILVFISLIMGTAYMTELFMAWYSGNEYELFTFMKNRVTGEYKYAFWTMITCNAIIPQLFWFKKIRKNITMVFIISLFINLGMWFERYVIVVTSLSKDFLPATWATYQPTFTEIAIFAGTIGLFILGVLTFFRFVPTLAISEIKGVLKETTTLKSFTDESH
ncbi:MAG: hydrogenase [Bacteroidetes bacterium]|nr:MAG: hydrogenase [Bacteroidota bacterium]